MTTFQTNVRIAIRNNLRRRDIISNMNLPYGSHCIAYGTHQLDMQLQQLISLIKGGINA